MFWHPIWHTLSHVFRQSMQHSLCHSIWREFLDVFWHLFWHYRACQVSLYLTYILIFSACRVVCHLSWFPVLTFFQFFPGVLFGFLSSIPSASGPVSAHKLVTSPYCPGPPAPPCWRTCYSVPRAGEEVSAGRIWNFKKTRDPHLAGGEKQSLANSIRPRNIQVKPWNQWLCSLGFCCRTTNFGFGNLDQFQLACLWMP